MIRRDEMTGIVLAGGQGRRMGGVDKGLVLLDSRPMVAHVLERLRPQVAEILINANQNAERYAAFGDRVVTWNAPDVTIDGVVYLWPEDSSDVRQLFEE